MSEKSGNKTTAYSIRFILKAVAIGGLVLTIVSGVQALNILANPNFNTSLASWSTFVTTWDGSLNGSPWSNSGSARSVNSTQSCVPVIWQCLNGVSSGLQYDVGGKIYIPAGQTPIGRGWVTAQWFSNQTCFGGPLSTNTASSVESITSTNVWATSSLTAVVAPSGTATVLLSGFNCVDTAGNFQLNFDDMFLQPSPADVSIAKAAVPMSIQPGELLSYTLTFSNTGPVTATGVMITDVLPTHLTNLSYQSSLPVVETGTVSYTWNVLDLSPGMTGTITVTGIVSASLAELPLIFTNTATITTTAFDPNSLNNSSAVPITIKLFVNYLPSVLKD